METQFSGFQPAGAVVEETIAVKLIFGVLAGLVGTCIVGVVILGLIGVSPNTVPFEVAKALLQIGLVGAAGATLTALTERYQHEREQADKARDAAERRRQHKQDLLNATLTQATESYHAVKRARRLLRARAVTGLGVDAQQYDHHLAAINDAQLEYETLVEDVSTNFTTFSNSTALVAQLRQIELYLHGLIAEYEQHRREEIDRPAHVPLGELPLLDHFLSLRGGRGGEHDERFAIVQGSFREFQRIIRADLMALTEGMADRVEPVAGGSNEHAEKILVRPMTVSNASPQSSRGSTTSTD